MEPLATHVGHSEQRKDLSQSLETSENTRTSRPMAIADTADQINEKPAGLVECDGSSRQRA